MRKSILFLVACTALDEVSTFTNLLLGGVELNMNVARLLSIHPVLYSLLDLALILTAYVID